MHDSELFLTELTKPRDAIKLMTGKFTAMWLMTMASFILTACVSTDDAEEAEFLKQHPNTYRGAPLVAAGNWLDTKETVDNGNDPSVAGCQNVYTTQNATCGVLDDRWGDYCENPNTHIRERVVGVQCVNGRQPRPLRVDCRVHLNDPRARCVEVPNACPPGNRVTGTKSARCEIPAEPTPTPTPDPVPDPLPNPTTTKESIGK